jgi:hypothetical protein
MELVEWLIGILSTIALGLSGWVLAKVARLDSAMLESDSRTSALEATVRDTAQRLNEQHLLLSELRDTMLQLNMAVAGTNSSDGLLEQFRRFVERYEDRSQKNEQLTQALDKRLALVELHLQYYMPHNERTRT